MAAVSAPQPEERSQAKFPELKFTNDNLLDNIKIIQEGNILAFYTTSACLVFHNLESVDLSERRVVYLDCNSHPNLLAEGEWEWAIRRAIPDVTELQHGDPLRDKIIEQINVPHREYTQLGYKRIKAS